jgi:hypothetical protein
VTKEQQAEKHLQKTKQANQLKIDTSFDTVLPAFSRKPLQTG